MEVINVSLRMSNDTQLVKIYECDRHRNCSYFKNDTCCNMNQMSKCEFGQATVEWGFKEGTPEFEEFREKWEYHAEFNKLNPANAVLGLINDDVIFPYPYVVIKDDYSIAGPSLASDLVGVIPKKVFTVEYIRTLCEFVPESILGGAIIKYQKDIVPLFLLNLRTLFPDLYAQFIDKYPTYAIPNQLIGRFVLLHTLSPSILEYHSPQFPSLDSSWYWDGTCLKYMSGHFDNPLIAKSKTILEFKYIPFKYATVEITNLNVNQIVETTEFVK